MSVSIQEELFGIGSRKAIGKLVLRGGREAEVGTTSYPKVMIGGVVYGNLTDGLDTELWECGFRFVPSERYNDGKRLASGLTINDVLTLPGWDDPTKHWGGRGDPTPVTGIGKILVYHKGASALAPELTQYMVGGVIAGKGLDIVGNQELWIGEMMLTPTQIFVDTDKPGVIGNMRLDQVLCSPAWYDGENYGTRRFSAPSNKALLEHYID